MKCSLLDGVCSRNSLLFLHFGGRFELLYLCLLLVVELLSQVRVLLAVCVLALAKSVLVLDQIGL